MQTFELTPEQFDQKRKQVEAAVGHSLDPVRGTISYKGSLAAYQYEASTNKLAVEITHTSWPEFMVRNKISEWFKHA